MAKALFLVEIKSEKMQKIQFSGSGAQSWLLGAITNGALSSKGQKWVEQCAISVKCIILQLNNF